MNIPQSSIEPFGVIGMPQVSMVETIKTILSQLFGAADKEGSSVYDACMEFEELIANNIAKMGLDSIIIETSQHVTDSHGVLLGRQYRIMFRIPNLPQYHSKVFHFGAYWVHGHRRSARMPQ